MDYFERLFLPLSGNLKYFPEVFGISKMLDELRADPRVGVFLWREVEMMLTTWVWRSGEEGDGGAQDSAPPNPSPDPPPLTNSLQY